MSVPATPQTSQPPTGSATPALPPQPATPALPPPSDLDFIPDLHKLLTRLLAPPPLPTATHQPGNKDGPLEMQQLATEANAVKRKIQRARDKVMALPEVDRTVEDQRDEITYLEERIARLKAALCALGRPPHEDSEVKAEAEADTTSSPNCTEAQDVVMGED